MLNVRRGGPVDVPEGFKSGEMAIDSLKEDTAYRFLEAPERLLQEEKLALRCTTKTYHCQTLTEFTRAISWPCQCCRTLFGPTLVSDRLAQHRQAGTEDRV